MDERSKEMKKKVFFEALKVWKPKEVHHKKYILQQRYSGFANIFFAKNCCEPVTRHTI